MLKTFHLLQEECQQLEYPFRVDMTRAQSIFLTNTTLTTAVAIMLDNIGFSNYVFKGFDDLQQLSLVVGDSFIYPDSYPPVPPGIEFQTDPYTVNGQRLERA